LLGLAAAALPVVLCEARIAGTLEVIRDEERAATGSRGQMRHA
jgi:hypothetical protein